MRKRLIVIGLITAVIIGLAALGYYSLMSRHLLLFPDGRAIQAKDAWEMMGVTFYKLGDQVRVVNTNDLAAHVHAFSWAQEDIQRRLSYYAGRVRQSMGGVGDGLSFLFSGRPGSVPILVIVGLVVLGATAGLYVKQRSRGKDAPKASRKTARKKKNTRGEPMAPRLIKQDDVVQFFLELYRMQSGAPIDASGKIEPLETEHHSPGHLYQLSVQIGNKWKSRRMTISPIGESTASRSQCFYVIYDTHMVVKIPPVPIRDYSDYIRRIQYEAGIVKTLSPRKCLIPNLSVILSKVHRVGDAASQTPEQVEQHYLEMLKQKPAFQRGLQIEGAFVFFMDLSRDYFLGHVMAGIGNRDLREHLAEDSDMMLDCSGFEARYGTENVWICFDLQSVYTRFVKGIRQMQKSFGPEDAPGDAQLREWFHDKLVDPSATVQWGSGSFRQAAGELLENIITDKADLVTAYRKLSLEKARQVSFKRNRAVRNALVTNLLDLLQWLGERRVAIRDLKPDNLFVSGDPSRYPLFLSSAQDFSVGLIDLETAMICPKSPETEYPQPQLGGTPIYATPSHFIPNKYLVEWFPDLGQIFLMQDWYASIGIIYTVVTSERLFQRTAELFGSIIYSLKQAKSQKKPVEPVFRSCNERFWLTAREEFFTKTARHAAYLNDVIAELPDQIIGPLRSFLDEAVSTQSARVEEAVANQSLLRDETVRQKFRKCSHQAVMHAIEKSKKSDSGQKERFLAFFQMLAAIKLRQERLQELAGTFSSNMPRFPVKAILEAMFEKVATVMGGDTEPLPDTAVKPTVEAEEEADAVMDKSTLEFTHSTESG